jgi:tetratricopeptide (TPR) repeat protein
MKPRIGSAFTASRAWILFIPAPALFLSGPARAADGDVIDRITSAPAFLQRILWTGAQAPPVTESDALWSALEQMRDAGPQAGFAALDAFVARHPNSAWTPSVRANLAYMYREHGRYTPALEHWEQAWAATRHHKTGDGKAVADYALAHWTRLLASLGRAWKLSKR